MKSALISIIVLTVGLLPVSAEILHVPADYNTIQSAIDAANDGDTVLIAPGTYTGDGNRDISFLGKAITVTSASVPDNCIIDCEGIGGGFVFENNEDTNSVLSGVTIMNSSLLGPNGSAISCWGGSPKIENCIMRDNNGCAIILIDSGGTTEITNCLVIRNGSSGIISVESPAIVNSCIIAQNKLAGIWAGGFLQITNCIIHENQAHQIYEYKKVVASYSNVQGGFDGEGNIDADPCFAFGDDYHLLPSSPCLDSGDPNYLAVMGETDLDGNPRALDGDGDSIVVVDMGAYEFNPNQPSIAVSPQPVSLLLNADSPGRQSFYVRNCGGGILDWSIFENCEWLKVNPACGSSHGQINEVMLSVDANLVTPGDYACKLTVLSTAAVNNPVTVEVKLYVAHTLHVPADYYTIQSAIDAAQNGDTVLIAPGIYTGDGNRDIDFLGKAITVRSIDPNDWAVVSSTIIDADYKTTGFNFTNAEKNNSVLMGLTVTHTKTAVNCDNAGPTINKCIITENKGNRGAAVYSWGYFDRRGEMPPPDVCGPQILDCIITQNLSVFDGGGIYIRYKGLVSGCYIAHNQTEDCGGGIFGGSDVVTIENCVIEDNFAEYYGGGVLCFGGIVRDCIVRNNNTSGNGGGIYIKGTESSIANCTFNGNSAGKDGGAVSLYRVNLSLTECNFSANSAGRHGGAVSWESEYQESGFISNCIFEMNIAMLGGAVSASDNAQQLTFDNCIFTANSGSAVFFQDPPITFTDCVFLSNSGKYGGAVDGHGPRADFRNCLLTGNFANSRDGGGGGCGGALAIHGRQPSDAPLSLENCTIVGNWAERCSGAIVEAKEISNCIIRDNWAPLQPQIGWALSVNHSNVEGGWEGKENIDAEPCFVQPGYWGDVNDANVVLEPNHPDAVWVDGDYRLLAESACIDAGDPNFTGWPGETDLAGEPRVLDGDKDGVPQVDMGAYEYVPPIEAQVRIMPQVINLKSMGNWILCRITLPQGYKVRDIERESILLEGQVEPRWVFASEKPKAAIAMFSRGELLDLLAPGRAEVLVTGELTEGTAFEGKDVIFVIDPPAHRRTHGKGK